jgi:hypothetical protein
LLAHLLHCCGPDTHPGPYQDLAPALHAALQHKLVSVGPLAQAILTHHASHMVSDQQLLGLVLDAAEQGEAAAADVLAVVAPKVLQVLEDPHPAYQLVHARVTALLAGGTAAGAAFVGAAGMEGGTLWRVQDMVEAACSGLMAACREAAAVDASTTSSSINNSDSKEEFVCLVSLPPAHTVLLQYLRRLVGVVLHLATAVGLPLSTMLTAGPLVPALAEVLSLLLSSLQLPGSSNRDIGSRYGCEQRPYHDAAWAALLVLSECPGTAALVAALLQHQPGLLPALAKSWTNCLDPMYCEEPLDNAACLAARLLLSGSIPGREERQQQEQLVGSAIHLWLSPGFWMGRAGLLMELLRLPQGLAAVVQASDLLMAIFSRRLLGDHEQEGLELLLAAPGFAAKLVEGLGRQQEEWLMVVEAVNHGEQAYTQALLAIPGLGEALAQCCSMGAHYRALDWILGDALTNEVLQAYLAQQPVLLQALVARVRAYEEHSKYFWDCLAEVDGGDGWLLQQPALLDGVVAALAVVGRTVRSGGARAVAERLLEVAPSLVCESLVRQPCVLEELLRVLVQRHWHPHDGNLHSGDIQLMLLGKLAASGSAPHALVLLPGLLAKGDAELSTGVFEAMHLMQSRMEPGKWGAELAAISSKGAEMLCAEEQLQALRQGVEEVDRATAAAAAVTQQLQEQQRAVVAAGARPVAGEHLAGRSHKGNRQLEGHRAGGPQQSAQPAGPGVQLRSLALHKQAAASSSKRKEGSGQQPEPAVGRKQSAGGRMVPDRVATRAAAAAAAGEGGDVPPASISKRTRR